MITEEMKSAIKDSFAAIIAETEGGDVKQIRDWLNTVQTAEDFFGQNKRGLSEYNNFIAQKEFEFTNAKKRHLKKV